MTSPFHTTLLIALKQGVNGVFNTLVAMAIFMAVSYRGSPRKLPSLRQLLFVSLSLFVLVPAMGYFYFDIERSLDHQLQTYRETTSRVCNVADHSVSLWLNLNMDTVTALARLVEYPIIALCPRIFALISRQTFQTPAQHHFFGSAVLGGASLGGSYPGTGIGFPGAGSPDLAIKLARGQR